MRGVTLVVAVLGANDVPLSHVALNVDRPLLKRSLLRARALVLADILHHLIEIVVVKATRHGLNVTGILGVEGVHVVPLVLGVLFVYLIFVANGLPLRSVARATAPSACPPFVPARDHDQRRINLLCIVKVLLECKSQTRGGVHECISEIPIALIGGNAVLFGIASTAVGARAAVCPEAAHDDHLLDLTGRRKSGRLRIHIRPCPSALAVLGGIPAIRGERPALACGEEIHHFIGQRTL